MNDSIAIAGINYRVEKVDGEYIAYHLYGPRATYSLLRTVPKPEVLFPISGTGRVCEIRGVKWFSDKGGELRAR